MKITPAVPDPPEIEERLWQGFSDARISFDVGANCGQTLPRIRSFTSGAVVAFEPSEEAFAYLADRFFEEDRYVLCPKAVSIVSGTVSLEAVPGKIETGQLVTAGTPGMEWSPDLGSGEVRVLECVSLDDYVAETGLVPDFIKIDVEGHEGFVISGAVEVLKHLPELLIEIHSEELGNIIFAQLTEDYKIQAVRHPHYAAESPLWKNHFWFKCFPLQKK